MDTELLNETARPHRGHAGPLTRVADILYKLLEAAIGIGLVVLVATVTVQIVGRYAFRYAPIWSEVLAGYILVWITFLGSACLIRFGLHLSVSMLLDALRGLPRQAVELLSVAASVVFAVVLLRAGWQQVEITLPMASVGLGISAAWLYLAAPFSALAMLIFLVERAISIVRQPREEHE